VKRLPNPTGENDELMTYQWLLFDADGTLFDYDRAESRALKNTFDQLGYPFEEPYLAEYRRVNHTIWLEFEQGQIDQITLRTRRFELLFQAINVQADPYEFSPTYLANLAEGTYLIDGAVETLELLSGNFNLAIITNGLKEVQRPRFRKSAINGYIETIIISDEVGVAKPDPKIFDIAFTQMNQPAKNQVLIIGDSLTSDIQGGRNYGIDTCWFNPAGKRNDHQIASTFEIQRLAELLELLEKLEPGISWV
jgi:2-haloacid dehalogenase